MEKPKNCFVIIGYGKKTSYAGGKMRVLDLDETYELLIKPALDALNIPCYRAIDKNISGSIDKLMLEEIRKADLALVDLSTLNANVMWELGVRHALKPRHTVMICEKEQMSSIPFDIKSFVVHQYTHSEEGIPHKEVARFTKYLKELVEKLSNPEASTTDSPVFTFLGESMPTVVNEPDPVEEQGMSFSDLLRKAEEAKSKKDFKQAYTLFAKAKGIASANSTLKDNISFIISRMALCTYQSKDPSEKEALEKAIGILTELDPRQTSDLEVLGLSGAIQKRLYSLTKEMEHLSNAIYFYQKGFTLKQDYYNGINAAFMLYLKAGLEKAQGLDWEDTKTNADYIRNAVLSNTLELEKQKDFLQRKDAIWILLTIAEAYNYRSNKEKLSEYEEKAGKLARETGDEFAMSSYEEQKKRISQMVLN